MEKGRFHQPEGHYFLSHSIGLQPVDVADSINGEFLHPWQGGKANIWDHWLKTLTDFRSALGQVIGANENEICQQTNISSALTKILFAIPRDEKRRTILLAREDFPTIGHVLKQAERFGYRLQFLDGALDLSDPITWISALHDDVAMLHMTHVFSNSSTRTPVREVIQAAKRNGIITIVDIAQSTGTIAVDVNDWQADFVTGTSVKYLCGGPGAAFMWVNRALIENWEPIDVGWFSHKNPFEFDIENFEYSENATRFLGGTPSVLPFACALPAIKLLGKIGIQTIEAHNQSLLQMLIDNLPSSAILSATAKGARGSAILVRPRDVSSASQALSAKKIIHDRRGSGLRFSVHLYNDRDDVTALTEAVLPLL